MCAPFGVEPRLKEEELPAPATVLGATRNPAFVCRDQRESLLAAYVALVRDHGYDRVDLEFLAEHAGVAPEVVGAHFASPLDCALAACDASSAQCFSAVATAFMATAGDCPVAAREALRAMLESMAQMPDFVHLIVAEYPRLGPAAQRNRRRYIDLFAEFLGPGFAAAAHMPAQPEVLTLVIAGGIYEVLAKHYYDGRLEELPQALPGIVFITVAPFFGVEEARRVAALPERSQA